MKTIPMHKLMHALIVALVCALPVAAKRTERVVDSWKPINYDVSIVFNDALSEFTSAKTQITLVALKDAVSTIDLDFGDLPIDSVAVNNGPAQFERSAELLKVLLPATLAKGSRAVIAIAYHGRPKDGLVLTTDKAGKPSAVGDNWPNRVHQWIPCLDHPSAKASVTFSVNAPARNVVVANGKLETTENHEQSRTWRYTESVPIPSYCMIIAVGEFSTLVSPQQNVTSLSYYVPLPDAKLASQGFSPADPALKFFSQTIAPYPYEKLALIVGATRFGGMENSSAIVFPSTLFDAQSNAEQTSPVFQVREGIVHVVAHEIAHQWFGDSVTESTWSDLWLSEGFATYFAGLFIERYESRTAFERYMVNAANEYLNYEKKTQTPIHDEETEDLFKLLNPNNYQKGAWVLHMLRAELGDEVFFRALRNYYNEHKDGIADTDDLRRAFEKASGRNLRQFFSSWIYGTGHPRYELAWKWTRKSKTVRLALKQVQTQPAFPNDVEVELITPAGTRRIVMKPGAKETLQNVRLSLPPAQVVVDPDNDILDESVVVKRN